jgi:Fe-S-cluster containining protein
MTKEGAQPGEVFTDLHLIAPMVIYLGPKAKSPRYVNSHEKGPDVHRYRCKHWDSKTQDCTIYEIRPLMCREYPGRDKCNFAACTWESNKRKKRPAESLTGLGKVIEKVKLIGEK